MPPTLVALTALGSACLLLRNGALQARYRGCRGSMLFTTTLCPFSTTWQKRPYTTQRTAILRSENMLMGAKPRSSSQMPAGTLQVHNYHRRTTFEYRKISLLEPSNRSHVVAAPWGNRDLISLIPTNGKNFELLFTVFLAQSCLLLNPTRGFVLDG
ncbi:hypothetical protein BDN71DRAFT_1238254 [Pleurotus eryngii]|uniref:Secreted protein n=1 Tax=Pleurotus eryngii TaxID=5323 RepID=A0A9P5ZR47_PLEER|nr:hypothetical protein BDN71DRAFT_1238254 [Pleurotus eryngii]